MLSRACGQHTRGGCDIQSCKALSSRCCSTQIARVIALDSLVNSLCV